MMPVDVLKCEVRVLTCNLYGAVVGMQSGLKVEEPAALAAALAQAGQR